MKIIELTNKYLIPLTNEESDLYSKFEDGKSVSKMSLSEREQLIANQLVVKDILIRKNDNGKIAYKKKIKISK